MTYRSVNPFDGSVLETFQEIDDDQLERALQTAHRCFGDWRSRTFAERGAVLTGAAIALRVRIDELARPITLEMGKLIKESRAEVELTADILEYFTENAERFLAPEKLDIPLGKATIENSPLGVIFGVQPWNFPYYQLARVVAPNLMAGNVVMVKHASSVPRCALAFARLLEDAGAPTGAYTNLFVTKDQIARIIEDPAGRQAPGGKGRLHAAHHLDRHQAWESRLHRGALRARRAVLPRSRRGRGDRARQRHAFRPGRVGVHPGHPAWQARRPAHRERHGVHQPRDLVRP